MKTIIPIVTLILLAVLASCKKDDTNLPTDMRVVVDKDTAFITSNVTVNNRTAGILYINGISQDGNQKVELGLSNYSGKNGTFYVDHRGLNGSTAYYKKGSSLMTAQNGRIFVTAIAEGVIKGTFELYTTQSTITGSFTAPQN